MLVNKFYNSASSVFYSLKQQGYTFDDIIMYGHPDDSITEAYMCITTPRNTRVRVRQIQFVDAAGEFVDAFSVVSVTMNNGEYCKGKKFTDERWDMLMNTAEKRSNITYDEYRTMEKEDAQDRLLAVQVH